MFRNFSRIGNHTLAGTARAYHGGSPVSLPGGSSMADGAQLLGLSAGEAVARMSRGEVTVEHYASVLLERCRHASALNAFITLEPDQVLEAARACDRHRQKGGKTGPLFGLPIPVKDSVNTRDYPTTAGTPALRHFRPAEDAPVVKALKGGGAIVLGKTNLHELSFGYTCNNLAFGAVHNPYDPRRIPGGSSGGTAVAIAAHMAPLGVAEDTEGSIRVPAALCGISGFRPTTGRYPDRWLRAHFTAIRSGRAACPDGHGSLPLRCGRGRRLAATGGNTSKRVAVRSRAQILFHRSRP